MNNITGDLLRVISGYDGEFKGAYNIRENGQCAARQSTDNIKIEPNADSSGLTIRVAPGTKGESVFIPACVTKSDFSDLVYNDIYIGEDADVTIIAGCGVHSDGEAASSHNGIHRFIIEKGAKAIYKEKHIGTGHGTGKRSIDPVTEVTLAEDSYFEIDTIQLSGVDSTVRKTSATLSARSRLIVRERLMTDGDEFAKTDFEVFLRGEDSGADLISRSVARGSSRQEFYSVIQGEGSCTGHSACDAILADSGTVIAVPSLNAMHPDAALIHEAAIGKIAGEQILKLRTLGLTEEESEQKIIEGFLK